MQEIPAHISQYIESQFPAIFREEGPVLIQFVTAYYEWMESTGQALYHARRLPSYRDIDTTIDEFVTHFKLKYLPNIQFSTASSRRLFVKNALDFHRSKGSSRSVELFFKLIYGVASTIYYPGDDLFRVSDGEWIVPTYLEVTPSVRNASFVGQTIYGVTSFASAFVESYNRLRVKGKYIEVFYLSNISGTFLAGEVIKADTLYSDNPRVQGSTTSINVYSGGAGFFVGERIGIISDNGQFATGIVSGTANVVGAANVFLIEGGFGYSTTSEILISERSLLVSGLTGNVFLPLEEIREVDDTMAILSTAMVIGSSQDHTIVGNLVSGEVQTGQILVQGPVEGLITKINKTGSTVTIDMQGVTDYYKSSQLASTPTGTINITSYSTLVGIANVSGPGIFQSNANIVTVTSGLNGNIRVSASTSNDLTFKFSSNNRFDNPSEANVGLDYIRSVANTRLNAASYSLPKSPAANVSTLMIDALFYETRFYGTISNNSITGLNNGSGYSKKPFIAILEDIPYSRRDSYFVVEIDNQQSTFILGERVSTGTMAANGTFFASDDPINGIVKAAVVNETVTLSRLSVDRHLYEHDPQNFAIIGETSGAAARMRKVNVTNKLPYTGFNAIFSSEVFTSQGLVTKLDMETSGYGYSDGESVTFFSIGDKNKTGLATLSVKTHGIGAGYYGTKGGMTSGTKHLQDNDYYQEYSYEIRTSIQQDTYKQMFDQVLHVAGTKGFSSYLSEKSLMSPISIAETQLII